MIWAIKEKISHFFDSTHGHGLDHTERVVKLAKYLGKKENADLEIIEIASIMHDIGRQEETKTKWKTCHATYGATLAKNILEELWLEQNKIEKIYHCIYTHRSRNNNEPESIEAKVLFDADKIDSLWATGIGRLFMFASHVWAKLHNDKWTNIYETESYTEEDTAYREFVLKLSKIKDKLYTNSGKELAQKRHEVMVKFFEDLNEEIWWLEE